MHGIAEYYDKFFATRMSRYRTLGNRRLDVAKRRARSLVSQGDSVADFGCGIGIVSEAMASAHKGVRVVGVDASSANIEYAKNTINRGNVQFEHVNVDNGCEVLANKNPNGYNIITLIDVIEHIPEEERAALFQKLSDISADGATLFLTYPSPEYQTHIMNNNPSELQIIDNIIESHQLFAETAPAGWKLKEFIYVDIWMKNQYVHVIFQKCNGLLICERIQKHWFSLILEYASTAVLWPYRAWYYGWRISGRKK